MGESLSPLETMPADALAAAAPVLGAPCLDIVGFKVSTLPFEGNAALITHAALRGQGMWVMTLNLEMVARASTDPTYKALTESVDLFVADGMPILWLSRFDRHGPTIPGRTSGIDLTEHLLQRFPGRIGVLGGKAPRSALERLKVDPARIAFVEDGPIRPGELASVIAALHATRCQILFVALGVPKQDFVCRTLRAACPGLVCIGVGGTFEVLAGLVPRAPPWMRDHGLEWLFRLANEPLRLWRRYLLLYPRALPAIARWAFTVARRDWAEARSRQSARQLKKRTEASGAPPLASALPKRKSKPTA